ncbi:GSCOCG00010526001-RA-CDS, partial [Cotesia congregata]
MWKFGISYLLDSKELSDYIDGTDVEPDKVTKLVDWKIWKKSRAQAMVLLLSSVDHVLHPNLINCESPKAVWDKLKALYGETNEDEITSAWQRYYAYNIVDSEPINTQIEKFESLHKTLTDSGEKLSEKSIISKLLSSLTPRFSAFRMAWECTAKDEQRLTNLTARLIREDKRLKDSEESEMMSALQVNVMKKQFQQMKMRQETHQERQERLNKVRELKKRTRCHKCGKIGHWKRECTEQAENDEHQEVIGRESQTYICEVSALNTEDYIQEKDIWIADSGASMHMTWRREIFQNFNPSETIKHVKIADDKLLPISGTGVVNILVDLNRKVYDRTLLNVLLVPGLRRNLFSVGAVNKKKFSFHAYEQHCEVRDQDGELSSVGVRYGNLHRMLFKVKDP